VKSYIGFSPLSMKKEEENYSWWLSHIDSNPISL
jgi:hypothetical protein